MNIDVMIPAYDELPNLVTLIPKLQENLHAKSNINFRISVIHKHDEIKEVVSKLIELGVLPVHRNPTNSFGDAIRSAIQAIPDDSECTVFMDADGSHDPNTVGRLLDVMQELDVDVAIASRYVEGGMSDNHILLKAMSRLLNSVYGIVLGIDAKDISTNFKAYRSSHLKNLNLSCDKFDVLEEVLLKMNKSLGRKINIVEIPDHFHNRVHGVSKRKLGPFIIGYILTLFRLRFKTK